MALVSCKDCKKEFSTDAKRCPNCGAKPPAEGGGCLVPLMVSFFGVAFVVSFIAVGGSGSSKQVSQDPREYVVSTCRNFIKKSLHDPSSAEFDRVYPSPILEKTDTYSVTLPLRAANGFGAMRHFAVECTLHFDTHSEKFELTRLKETP